MFTRLNLSFVTVALLVLTIHFQVNATNGSNATTMKPLSKDNSDKCQQVKVNKAVFVCQKQAEAKWNVSLGGKNAKITKHFCNGKFETGKCIVLWMCKHCQYNKTVIIEKQTKQILISNSNTFCKSFQLPPSLDLDKKWCNESSSPKLTLLEKKR